MAGSPVSVSMLGMKIKEGIAEGNDYAHMPHQYSVPGSRGVYGSHEMREVTKPGKPATWLDVQAVQKAMRRDVIRTVFFSNILRAAAPANVPKIRALKGFNRYISKKIVDLKHFNPIDFDEEVLALTAVQKQTFSYLLALLKVHGESDLNLSNIAMSGDRLVLFDTDRQGYYWDFTLKELEDAIFIEQNDDGVEIDSAPNLASHSEARHRPRVWLNTRGMDYAGAKIVHDMVAITSDLYRPVTTQNKLNRRAQFKAFVTSLIQGAQEWIQANADIYIGKKIYKSFVSQLVEDHLAQLKQLKQKLMTSKLFREDFIANIDEYRQHVIETCEAYNATYSEKYQQSELVFDIEDIARRIALLAHECVEPPVAVDTPFDDTVRALNVSIDMGSRFSSGYIEQVKARILAEAGNTTSSIDRLIQGFKLFNESHVADDAVADAWREYRHQMLDETKRQLSCMESSFVSFTRALLPASFNAIVAAYKKQRQAPVLAESTCDRDCSELLDPLKTAVFKFEEVHIFKPLQKALTNAIYLDSLIVSLKLMSELDLKLTEGLLHDIERYFEHLVPHIVTVHPHKAAERINQALRAVYFYEKILPLSPVMREAKYRLSALATLLPCKGDYLFFGYKADSAKALGKFPKTAAKAVNEICAPMRHHYGGILNISMQVMILVEPKVEKTRFDRRQSTLKAYNETSALSFGRHSIDPFSSSDFSDSELGY